MLEILQAAVLGIVQGLTEFLPISSSAHLFVLPEVLGWQGVVGTLPFDVALHLGTTLAVVFFFWGDWLTIIKDFFVSLRGGLKNVWAREKARLLLLVLLGSIPAAVVGLLYEDFFETEARNLPWVSVMLIVFGVLLFISDRVGKKSRQISSLNLTDALAIGLSQALALIPGVSRSGVTITSALFRNLDRASATRFSFLLSTPIIVGASALKFNDIVSVSSQESARLVFLTGTIAAAVSGFIAIKVLLKFVQNNSFTVFVVYRLLLGLALLAMIIGI